MPIIAVFLLYIVLKDQVTGPDTDHPDTELTSRSNVEHQAREWEASIL